MNFDNGSCSSPLEKESTSPKVNKRWWGIFKDWLARMTTITKQGTHNDQIQKEHVVDKRISYADSGDLDLDFAYTMLLYSARRGCEQSTLQAGLDIYADAELKMNARYAYYLSGHLAPTPDITDKFAYFGVRLEAYVGLRINGNAALRYNSDRKKIIDTLAFPSLAVKGIAAVGPTLDLYGQMKGEITISGQMQIGVKYVFQPAETYWPKDSDSAKYQKVRIESSSPQISTARS
jgi:hypothetical protein